MFNLRPEDLFPWLRVEPAPADELPGFNLNPDGSPGDTQRGAPLSSFGFDPSASPSAPQATLTDPSVTHPLRAFFSCGLGNRFRDSPS